MTSRPSPDARSGAADRWLRKSPSAQIHTSDQKAETGFRAYSPEEFCPTPSWRRLEEILTGNGGCYGLYGPRGAGKSWLMLNAINRANHNEGMGLWYPSPSEYDANAFLSTLSDNLANAVERRFLRNNTLNNLLAGLRTVLIFVLGVPVVLALISETFSGISSRSQSLQRLLPVWLWVPAAAAGYILLFVVAYQVVRNNSPQGRLVREATALRERIRFTAGLKYGGELGLGGGLKSFSATFKRSQEKALSERPTTIASLVFDFRNLAESIADLMEGPIVIGIDELDKIEDPVAVRALLRDIKGIFEVTGVHFFVSVSEEASAALHLGTLQTGGRNEFNSSFYTVIELPPLNDGETHTLLEDRGYEITADESRALCLISAGNQRELVRIADIILRHEAVSEARPEHQLIVFAMEGESVALLRDIIRMPVEQASSAAKNGAWRALPRDSFKSVESFVQLGKSVIVSYWEPSWSDDNWNNSVSEPWKRLLVRLFVFASLLESGGALLSNDLAVDDLSEVMAMASQNADVARGMLEARSSSK